MKYYKFLIIIILFSQCNKLSKSEIILNDILPPLADSLKIDIINFVVEPPPPIYLNDSIFIGYDTLHLEKNKLKRENLIDSIKKIHPKILLPFNDSLWILNSRSFNKKLVKDLKLYDSIFIEARKHNFPKMAINHCNIILDNIELTTFDKLIHKYKSYPKIWNGINDRFFGGVLSIDGIVINEDANYGLMVVYYADIDIDGFDYIVSIVKENEKWKIKEFHNKWIYLNQN